MPKELEIPYQDRPEWMNLDYQAPLLAQNILHNLPEDIDPLHRILDRELGMQGYRLDVDDPEESLRKTYDLSSLPHEPHDLLKSTLILHGLLKYKYDLSKRQRNEYSKEQCQWGYNFGMTVRQVFNRTHDAEAVGLIASVLLKIADWPSAGSAAWEMRRFIRRANVEQTIEFGKLVLEMVQKHADKLDDGLFLSMDGLVWNGPDGVSWELERLRKGLVSYDNTWKPD